MALVKKIRTLFLSTAILLTFESNITSTAYAALSPEAQSVALRRFETLIGRPAQPGEQHTLLHAVETHALQGDGLDAYINQTFRTTFPALAVAPSSPAARRGGPAVPPLPTAADAPAVRRAPSAPLPPFDFADRSEKLERVINKRMAAAGAGRDPHEEMMKEIRSKTHRKGLTEGKPEAPMSKEQRAASDRVISEIRDGVKLKKARAHAAPASHPNKETVFEKARKERREAIEGKTKAKGPDTADSGSNSEWDD